MKNSDDSLWELAEYSAKEARLLRSFLEYLATWEDPWEVKQERIKNWKREIGLKLGAPHISDQAEDLFQTIRALPPEEAHEEIQKALNAAHSNYFD